MSVKNVDIEQNVTKEPNLLRQRLLYLYKRLWIIILAGVLGACMGFGVNKLFAKPTYTATATVLLIANLDDTNASSSAQTNATLAQMFLPETARLIRSPAYVNKANEKLDQADLTDIGYINARRIGLTVNDTLIFKITYTDATEQGAITKLKAIIATAEENLADPLIGIQASNVNLKPMYNEGAIKAPKNSSLTSYVLIGAAAGLVLSAAILLLINALDNTVKSKEDLEEIAGASVVAYIEDRAIK